MLCIVISKIFTSQDNFGKQQLYFLVTVVEFMLVRQRLIIKKNATKIIQKSLFSYCITLSHAPALSISESLVKI